MATYEKRNIGGSSYTVPTGTRSDWKPGQAYSNTPSTPKTTTATTTAKPATTTTTSSSSSKNSTYKAPSSGGIDTSGLSGYALAYANALNGGANDTQAHQYSTATNGGTGISGLTNGYENASNNPYLQFMQQQELAQQQQFDYGDMLDDIMGRLPDMPSMQPTLSYDAARKQSEDFYNPMYGSLMDQALNKVDQNNIARGFFGQLPGAALSRSTAADIENQKAQAIGQFANQLVGQSQQNALGMQELAQQRYNAQANALMGALNAATGYESGNQANIVNLMNAITNKQRADQEDEQNQANLLNWLYWGGGA